MNVTSHHFKTAVLISSLIIVPLPALLSGAEPDPGGGAKSAKAEAGPSFTISVKGLACPFCVYGLEKKLKKVEGIRDAKIDLKSGTAVVTYHKGYQADLAGLRQAVTKAGFTPGKLFEGSRSPSGAGKDPE